MKDKLKPKQCAFSGSTQSRQCFSTWYCEQYKVFHTKTCTQIGGRKIFVELFVRNKASKVPLNLKESRCLLCNSREDIEEIWCTFLLCYTKYVPKDSINKRL